MNTAIQASTMTDLPSPECKCYDVWLATRLSVRGATLEDAEQQAVARLSAFLADFPGDAGIAITRPTQQLQSAAVLALQLMTLDKNEGEIFERVHRLRAEMEAEVATARAEQKDEPSV